MNQQNKVLCAAKVHRTGGRHRFVGTAAMIAAAAELGIVPWAMAKSGRKCPSHPSAIKGRPNILTGHEGS